MKRQLSRFLHPGLRVRKTRTLTLFIPRRAKSKKAMSASIPIELQRPQAQA